MISAVYLYLVFDSQSSLFTVQDLIWELTGYTILITHSLA